MDKKEAIERLRLFRAELSKHINLKKMILFGSYANNRQNPDSDIDVAIVVDKIQGDYLQFLSNIWKLRAEFDSRIEPVVFEESEPDYSGFLETIKKTGLFIEENE